MNYLGCDIAPNHSGLVMLNDDGDVVRVRYTHDMKGVVDHHKSKAIKSLPYKVEAFNVGPKRRKTEDPEPFKMRRLYANYLVFKSALEDLSPTHLAIEGYAFSRGTSAYTIAETAGLLKLLTYHLGLPLRVYSTNDVKLFATSFGAASKDQVHDALIEGKGIDFSAFKKGSKDDIVFDLADAFVLADLVRTESLLRCGKLRLDHLNENAIRVFQRATAKHPVSLLGRDWIQK